MTSTEDRLRDAFRADAETIQPGSIRPAPARPEAGRLRIGRLRTRRLRAARPAGQPGSRVCSRTVVAAIAAAAAVTAIAVAATVAGNSGGPQPGALSALRAPAPPAPRYLVGLSHAGLTVYNAATGRRLGTIAPPSRKMHYISVAAAAPGHFVVAAVPTSVTCSVTRLYRLTLTRQGGLGRLAPLPRGRIGGMLMSPSLALAASSGGRVIAYAASHCGNSQGWVGVIRPGTGQTRRWPLRSGGVFDLTLTPDGRTLYFNYSGNYGGDGTIRALPAGAPAGPVPSRARIVLPASSGVDAGGGIALADHGRILLACREVQSTDVLLAYSASTGHELAVLHTWRNIDEGSCTLSMASSGGYLLIPSIGTHPWRIRLSTGRARQLPKIGAADDPVFPVAW